MGSAEKHSEEIDHHWADKAFIAELDDRYKAILNGEDNGVTTEELIARINKSREDKYR